MINQANFGFITLSKTWLKSDKHLLGYVRLPGYKFAYRNWHKKSKHGRGVGSYIRYTIGFQVRNSISKLNEYIGNFWVEIQGKKKNSAYLIGIFYHPSSENNKKIKWIKKLDSVLSIVKLMRSGIIMINGGNVQSWLTCINRNLEKIHWSTWNL